MHSSRLPAKHSTFEMRPLQRGLPDPIKFGLRSMKFLSLLLGMYGPCSQSQQGTPICVFLQAESCDESVRRALAFLLLLQ